MAIKYDEIKMKLDSGELTKHELELVSILENYIDSIITKTFDNKEILIEMVYVDFVFSPSNARYDIKDTRRRLMRQELDRRYKEAGWDIKEHYDDGLDGNMSGPDYWIITGK